ncbi:MAG: P-II family nitrogen regulator [Vicinamibacterales bacterium]|nr:P-II family nitrogen regulator [Vicinamibacterales bacterium]
MREVKAIIRPDRLSAVVHALHQIPLMPGVTVSLVQGFGRGEPHQLEAVDPFGEARFAKVEVVVPAALVKPVVEAIRLMAHTGRPGDGKIFVIPVDEVTRISTGEEGEGGI